MIQGTLHIRAQKFAIFAALLLAAMPAVAGTILTDPATFQSSLVSSNAIQDFGSFTYNSQPNSPLLLGDTAYWLTVSAPGGLYIGDDHAAADRFLRVLTQQDAMTIAFGPGINAFGAVIYQTNLSQNGNGVPVTVTFTDNTAHQFVYTIEAPSRTTFLGYVAPWETYLTSAKISGANQSNTFVSMDDVVAGFDTPEPATILLCGIGLIAAGFLKRRR